MKKIESLTEAQTEALEVYRQRGMDHGLRTKPLNRPRAEAAVKALYEAAGLKAPRMVWTLSPFSANLTVHILKNMKGREALGASVVASVVDSVGDSVRASVVDSVGASVGASVRDSVRASVWASVGASVGASKIENQSALWADPDAGWLVWYDYYKEQLKIKTEESSKEKAWFEFLRSCHWIYPFQNTCFLVDSPEYIGMDNRVIHNEGGMAVKYRDGWGVWAIEGVRVTEKIVMTPELLTVAEIENESNAETRRIMVERFGPKRYMLESGAECIDYSAGLGLIGSAPRALYKTKDGGKWLFGSDGSTRRLYFMPVPNEVTTCSQAHREISGLDKEERLLVEC